MEENIILSEISQAQKTKNHVLPHVDFMSRANAEILLDLGLMLKGEHIREKWG
jgi:hypothetical protein